MSGKEYFIFLVAGMVALLGIFLIFLGMQSSEDHPSLLGVEGLVGLVGEMGAENKVLVHGELWDTVTEDVLQVGDRVRVCGLQPGMKLEVKKI